MIHVNRKYHTLGTPSATEVGTPCTPRVPPSAELSRRLDKPSQPDARNLQTSCAPRLRRPFFLRVRAWWERHVCSDVSGHAAGCRCEMCESPRAKHPRLNQR